MATLTPDEDAKHGQLRQRRNQPWREFLQSAKEEEVVMNVQNFVEEVDCCEAKVVVAVMLELIDEVEKKVMSIEGRGEVQRCVQEAEKNLYRCH